MKTTVLAFVLLHALSISIQPLPVAANYDDACYTNVVDSSGDILRAGTNYYILPTAPIIKCGPQGRCQSHDAGLSLAGIGKYCPLDVVIVGRYGALPVSFIPMNPTKGVICASSDLNIQFSSKTRCPQLTVWKKWFDASSKKWLVTTGGILGNPGPQTIDNWFKIVEYEGDYTLVYCPDMSKSCRYMPRYVGLYVDENGNNRVALSETPYRVKFQKA